MVNLITSFIFLLAILMCLDCRPPTKDVISQYEKVFETSNCSKGVFLLSSFKNSHTDEKFQKSFLMPLTLCSNITVIHSTVTFSLCDEIFSVLFNIYCNLTLNLDPTFNEYWDDQATDICLNFADANFIKMDSDSYYISTSLRVKKLCDIACQKENKALCSVLLYVHRIQNSLLMQLEIKNNSEIAEITHSKSSTLNNPSTTELYLKKETEYPFTANTEMTKLNPKSHIAELQLENATVSNMHSMQTNDVNPGVLVKLNEPHENSTTKNQPYIPNSKEKNMINDLKKHDNEMDNDSLNKTFTSKVTEQKLNEEQPIESTGVVHNSSYLNDNHQIKYFEDANSKDLTYQKIVNNSAIDNNMGEQKNQSTASNLVTDMTSNEHLGSEDENDEFDANDLNDQEEILKEEHFSNTSSSSTIILQPVSLKHDIGDTQPTFNDVNESVKPVLHQKPQTEAVPVSISKTSENSGVETSIDDEPTAYDQFDEPIETEIEPKKSDTSVRSKFPMDNMPKASEDIFRIQEDSHFIFYFIVTTLAIITFYVVIHNKQKIIAIIVEGCHERRRRPHGVSYRKLDTN